MTMMSISMDNLKGNYPVVGGVYSNPNSKQFLQKLTPDLTTSVFSTVFGSGSAQS